MSWLYKHPWITCRKHKTKTTMTHIACDSKLCSIVRSSMHPFPGNWVAIESGVQLCIMYGLPTHLLQKLNVGTVLNSYMSGGLLANPYMLVVANFANTKCRKKAEKWLKPWQMGTHLRVNCKNCLMNTNMTRFRQFTKFFARWKSDWNPGKWVIIWEYPARTV